MRIFSFYVLTHINIISIIKILNSIKIEGRYSKGPSNTFLSIEMVGSIALGLNESLTWNGEKHCFKR